jgi:hypothetical protein
MTILCSRVGRVCRLIAAGIGINSWDSEENKNTGQRVMETRILLHV